MFVGIADTFVVSFSSEADVSGVSLTTSFNTVLILIFRWPLLRLLFGKTEADVMNACEIYLVITTLSLPALAIYDAGASLCRSIGKTNVTMYIYLITNIINIIGNCIGVFVFKLGAAGVALGTTLSQTISVIIALITIKKRNIGINLKKEDFILKKSVISEVLKIGIPVAV